MTDEETFKKIFALLGSPNEGERVAAFHQLFAFLQKRGKSFADLLATLSDNVPRAAYADLEQKLTDAAKNYNELEADFTSLERKYSAQQVIIWTLLKWRRLAAVAVVLTGLTGAYEFWPDGSAAERNAVDATLKGVVAKSGWIEGYSSPVVRVADGRPYWTMLFGETITDEHADGDGHPLTLQCVHLYAAPAAVEPTTFDPIPKTRTSDFPDTAAGPVISGYTRAATIFVKPAPFSFLGWLKWPERAAICRRAESRDASR